MVRLTWIPLCHPGQLRPGRGIFASLRGSPTRTVQTGTGDRPARPRARRAGPTGVSLGNTADGWVVDHLAPGPGYHVPAFAALLALLLSALVIPVIPADCEAGDVRRQRARPAADEEGVW